MCITKLLQCVSESPRADSDPTHRALVGDVASGVEGIDRVVPSTEFGASEDATFLMERVQREGGLATYLIVGTDHPTSHHTPTFDVDEDALERYAEARLAVAGWPTSVGEIVETEGAELDVLERARRTATDDPNRVPVTVDLEGSGPDHLAAVLETLDGLEGVSVRECLLDTSSLD